MAASVILTHEQPVLTVAHTRIGDSYPPEMCAKTKFDIRQTSCSKLNIFPPRYASDVKDGKYTPVYKIFKGLIPDWTVAL